MAEKYKPDSSFWAKYKDPLWQKKRLDILSRDEWACQMCLDDKSTLHVHHRYYLKGREPWDYENECFVTLCEKCHEYETAELPAAAHDLVLCFKKKFYSDQILEIAHAVDCAEFLHLPGVISAAIQMALMNPEVQSALIARYFKELAKNREPTSVT